MFAIAPTDRQWFDNLKEENLWTEVNFWTPTPWRIKSLQKESRLYFMLKSPIRKCAGFGMFVSYEEKTINEAWQSFGKRNGYYSKDELEWKIKSYIEKNSQQYEHYNINTHKIGCIVLNGCEFWEENDYLNIENFDLSFPKPVVKLKYFNLNDPIKKKFEERKKEDFKLVDDGKRFAQVKQVKREGQSQFKRSLFEAYSGQCCISGENIPELLEAAHIQPYINKKSNHIQNGLLLRKDLHTLFDNGLLSIDSSYSVKLSPLITSKHYLDYKEQQISLPQNPNNRPSIDALEFRQEKYGR